MAIGLGKKKIEYNDAVPAGRKDMIMEAWIGRHWKQVMIVCFITVFVTVMWSMINVNGLKNAVYRQSIAIENLSRRVIAATPDGRVVVLQTVEIPDAYIILVLRDIISKYLVFSSFEIQSNAGADSKKFAEYDKVKDFPTVFCITNKCKNEYTAFINSVWNAYKDGSLPEVIYTGTKVQETYKVQDKDFYYTLNLPVIMYTVLEGKWVKGEGTVDFVVQGKVDLQQSSEKNPWGIKITTFRATLPVKVR